MLFNVTLPSLSDISDKQNAEKIRGYLATLHDQLRYMMLNIDTDNLSDGLSSTITNAANDAEFSKNGVMDLKKSVVEMGNNISSVSQTADKINWLVSDGTSASNFSLTSKAASLIAETVDLKGLVKFTDLESVGSTSINGNNVISGTITADKLNVTDLSALSAKIGGWSLSDTAISSVASNGSISFNSASSPDYYWIKANNAAGYTTFYIAKNGSCYFNGSYISNGSITADKIMCDSESRLDLTNNYNGIKIGSGMVITNGNVNCRMFVNNFGVLTFDSGKGNSMFSFALNRTDSTYTLSVLNGSGQVVGTIPL